MGISHLWWNELWKINTIESVELPVDIDRKTVTRNTISIILHIFIFCTIFLTFQFLLGFKTDIFITTRFKSKSLFVIQIATTKKVFTREHFIWNWSQAFESISAFISFDS